MKILICPDKFKGSLSAEQVCNSIERGLEASFSAIKLPLADGGEGTAEILGKHFDGDRIEVEVENPIGIPVVADYFYSKKRREAYIEMAAASGLQLIASSERNPLKTSTIGTGQLLKHAVENGAEVVYLCIGGSATNEGGIGMANALGWRFLDRNGVSLMPVGRNLDKIDSIIKPDKKLPVKVKVLSDVQNVLTGVGGATYVYGRQKGASEDDLEVLEKGLIHLSKVVGEQLGINLSDVEGGGAAGGLGAGAVAFLNAEIVSGAKEILNLLNVTEQIKRSDMVLTGEGKFDRQTLQGKLVSQVCALANKYSKEVVVVCGQNKLTEEEWRSLGVRQVLALNEGISEEEAMLNASKVLEEKVKNIFKK